MKQFALTLWLSAGLAIVAYGQGAPSKERSAASAQLHVNRAATQSDELQWLMRGSPYGPVPVAAQGLNQWVLGGVLYGNLHMHGLAGSSTGDVGELSTGGHDPAREHFSVQALEPGMSLRTRYIEGFTNYLAFQDGTGSWDGEWEEAFLKWVNIPGGLELKAGQYLSRFGTMNNRHLHAWDFVDSETVISRFLGDDGLLLQGVELSWTLPFVSDPSWTSIVTAGFGHSRPHDHGHEHEEEGHDHEILHEGDSAAMMDDVMTARWLVRYRWDDFRSVTAGGSWASGDNEFGRSTQVSGIDVEYLWRENGLEPGGRAFRWRNECLFRDVDAYSYHEEEDESYRGGYQELGFYSHVIYSWSQMLDTSLRVGWVEGIDDFGQGERFRISPAISWWMDSSDMQRRVGFRTQYNYDAFAGAADEHSVWFQVNIALGDTQEVR